MSLREQEWYSLYPARGGLEAPAPAHDFFREPWLTRTTVRNFALRIYSVASVIVNVVAYDETPTPRLLVQSSDVVGETVVALPGLSEYGRRVSFEIRNAVDHTIIPQSSIRCEWVCDTPPLQQVVLGLAICTMNRERQIETLLRQCFEQSENFRTCVVINQGTAGLPDRLNFSSLPSHMHVVEQSNHGGRADSRGVYSKFLSAPTLRMSS